MDRPGDHLSYCLLYRRPAKGHHVTDSRFHAYSKIPLSETLLAEAGLLIGLSEGDKGSVILDDLAREAALGWDGGDCLVCAGGAA